ncbi:hypothetical protein ACTGVI_12720, partial [Streptococcus suis]
SFVVARARVLTPCDGYNCDDWSNATTRRDNCLSVSISLTIGRQERLRARAQHRGQKRIATRRGAVLTPIVRDQPSNPPVPVRQK